MEGHSITPTLTPKVMEEAEKAWSLKPKEYEPPVDQVEKERRARFLGLMVLRSMTFMSWNLSGVTTKLSSLQS